MRRMTVQAIEEMRGYFPAVRDSKGLGGLLVRIAEMFVGSLVGRVVVAKDSSGFSRVSCNIG